VIKMKKITTITILVAFLVISGCGKKQQAQISLSGASAEVLPDCTGYTSEMVIPHGFTGPESSKLGGQKFAKLTAVDSVDGTMKISIAPISSNFNTAFLNEFSEYKLRIISCREDISSVSSGSNTAGVCSRTGSINLIGGTTLTVDNFQSIGIVINDIKVHASRDPDYDTFKNYPLKPDFIMITATKDENDPLGEFMIAFGRSPYYTGCYNR